MFDVNKWFDFMQKDIVLAHESLSREEYMATHYFLGRLSGDIRVIRDFMSLNKRESDEPSNGS